jgi:hypothetical protein
VKKIQSKNEALTHIIILLHIFILSSIPTLAQEHLEENEHEKRHWVAIAFGYTHIPEATEDGQLEESVFVPTIGLDYFYKLNEEWFVGGAFDIEVGRYEVDYENEELTRETAIVFGALVGYELLPGWALLAGPGLEIEKNKNLFILRFSTEYTFELGKEWGLFPSFTYDFKKEYSSYAFGVGIKKRF